MIKLQKFIRHFRSKNHFYRSAFILLVLLLALPVGVYLVLNNISFFGRAETNLKSLDLRNYRADIASKVPSRYKQTVFITGMTVDLVKNQIVANSIRKDIGFLPNYYNIGSVDYLDVTLKDSQGKEEKYSVPLPVKEVYVPPRNQDEAVNYQERVLKSLDFTLVLPYKDGSLVTIERKYAENSLIKNGGMLKFQLPSGNETQVTIAGDAPKTLKLDSGPPLQRMEIKGNNYFSLETVFDGNPSQTDPTKTLNIVFVASGFSTSEMDAFRSFTQVQTDALIGLSKYPGKAPFTTNKPVIKVKRLSTTTIFHKTENGYTSVDHDSVLKLLTSLGIPYDQVSIVPNASGRSWSTLDGSYNVLFIKWGDPSEPLLLAHEIGHSFGGLIDEYVSLRGLSSSRPYYLNRNCKADPTDPWVANQPGGAYLGCEDWNLYRPEISSLMQSISEKHEFNAPSQYLLEQAFSAYTSGGYGVIVTTPSIRGFNDLARPTSYVAGEVKIKNLKLNSPSVSYRAYFSPSAVWVSGQKLEGQLPSNPYVNIDFTKIKETGSYKTNLIIDIASKPQKSVTVPIEAIVDNSNDPVDLPLVGLKDGQVIKSGSMVDLMVNTTIERPGLLSVIYYYIGPFQDPSNPKAYKEIVGSRTVAPYRVSWNTDKTADGAWTSPGLYTFYTEGLFLWQRITPSPINIEITARPNTSCVAGWGYTCNSNRVSRHCFRGANDCTSAQFCCPATTPTPTVTPILTPNPTSTATTTPRIYPTPTTPTVCLHKSPGISIYPQSQTGVGGQGRDYRMTITNNDAVGCSPSSFKLESYQLPSQWIQQPSWVRTGLLAPGLSMTPIITIYSSGTSANGTYSFTEKVGNEADQAYTSYASATYVLKNGTPTPTPTPRATSTPTPRITPTATPTAPPAACTASCYQVYVSGNCLQGSPCKTTDQRFNPLPYVSFGINTSGCQALSVDTSTNQFTGSDTPNNTWVNALTFYPQQSGYSSGTWNFCNGSVCWTFNAGQTLYWRLRDPYTNQVKAICSPFSAPAIWRSD